MEQPSGEHFPVLALGIGSVYRRTANAETVGPHLHLCRKIPNPSRQEEDEEVGEAEVL